MTITIETLKKNKLIHLPLFYLQKDCNPFTTCPWNCGKITKEEITQAIALKQFSNKPVIDTEPKAKHIARIAWLVVHKDDKAVELAVGNPSFHWFINDGNHRIAAAIYRNDAFILSEISVFNTKRTC
jgi:hypothetical protein